MSTESTGWIEPTMNAYWVNDMFSSAPESTCAYRQVGDYVELKGTVSKTQYSESRVIFTLPEGFRPNTMRWFPGYDGIRIYPNGDVFCANSATGVHLDFIRFSLT